MHRRFSTYIALIVWGIAAFMAQPTLASLTVHFIILPIFLFALVFVARHEHA